MAFCYGNAWIFFSKMSHHTSLSVKYSGRSFNSPPWEERGTYFATSPREVSCVTEVWCPDSRHTRSLCILHDGHFVAIALESLQRKNQYIGSLPHPLPSLACGPACTIWLHYRSRLTTQLVKAITSSFFVRFVWNFLTSFYTDTASL